MSSTDSLPHNTERDDPGPSGQDAGVEMAGWLDPDDIEVKGAAAKTNWGKPQVDMTDDNTKEVDEMADEDIEIPSEFLSDDDKNVLLAGLPKKPKHLVQPARPKYHAGLPDYACPEQVVENINLSKPNRSPVIPAGIRKDDLPHPAKFEIRDQLRFKLGEAVLLDAQLNPQAVNARANTGDQFVVTGQLPGLKGIKSSFMKEGKLKTCRLCRKVTRVGIMYVHGHDGPSQMGNHWCCEACGQESLANLPPHCICPVCFRVPLALFLTPHIRHRVTQRVVSEGFRR